MRYELPESELLIHVSYRREDGILVPLSPLDDPSPLGWTELSDGSLFRRQRFGDPGLPTYEVIAYLRGNGLVEIDAPGLVLDEGRGENRGTVRIRGINLPIQSLHFIGEAKPKS